MAKNQEYGELFNLHCVLLRRQDLFALEKLLVDDPRTDRLKLQVSFDSTSVTAESVEDLLKYEDLPTFTDKLSLEMHRWTTAQGCRDISAGVSLTLHHNFVNCHISSMDRTWFLGKKAEVEKFFKLRRPWYAWLNKIAPSFPAVALLLLFHSVNLLSAKNYRSVGLPIASSAVLGLVAVLAFNQKLFPFVRICLQETGEGFRLGFNEWCAIIGAISGLAAIVQLVVDLSK